MADVLARDVEAASALARARGGGSTRSGARAFLAETFHGLTQRRLAVMALFGLVLCVFSFPVALTYARGLPVSQIALAILQTYFGTVVGFFPGLAAAVATYNRTPGGATARVIAATLAIGLAVWLTTPPVLLIRNAPIRDVLPHVANVPIVWLSMCIVVAVAAAALLYMTHEDDVERAVEAEARRALDLERGLDEARLQAAQAQIEPHFLFNTLANIRRLYEVDREAARTMLRQFSHMLGRSLPDIRNAHSTLAREVELALAYLSVQKIRMAERLEYATDIPPALRDAALPPMMLSTLVENAIKHALAPRPEGGRVTISARADRSTLVVRVIDDGCGLSESSGSGVGLANIETRLAAMFGNAGALCLEPNEHGGVTASLELPLQVVVAGASDA